MHRLVGPLHRSRWKRFSLGALLILITVAGALLGWLSKEVERTRAEERAVLRLSEVVGPAENGGQAAAGQLNVHYGSRFDASGPRDMLELLPPPIGWRKYLADWVGVNIFHTVKGIQLYAPGSVFKPRVDELGRYRSEARYACGLSDENAALLASFPHIDFLGLECNPITDEGARQLRQLTNLSYLNLSNTQVTDEIADVLAELSKLESLNLSRTRVGAGVAETLAAMKNLKRVNVESTWMTREQIAELKRQLPECEFEE